MNQERAQRLTLESGWAKARGGRLETQRLYLNTTIPREWMPSRHRKRGTSCVLTCEFPANPRRWWGIVRYALANDRDTPGDLVGPFEHEPYVVRHAANAYTRTWATGDDIHMSTTINRKTVSQVAEACPGLDPLWIGSRFVDRAILGAVRWHHVHGVVELWMPLSASEAVTRRTLIPAPRACVDQAWPAGRSVP
jgi:hypothetical protein